MGSNRRTLIKAPWARALLATCVIVAFLSSVYHTQVLHYFPNNQRHSSNIEQLVEMISVSSPEHANGSVEYTHQDCVTCRILSSSMVLLSSNALLAYMASPEPIPISFSTLFIYPILKILFSANLSRAPPALV